MRYLFAKNRMKYMIFSINILLTIDKRRLFAVKRWNNFDFCVVLIFPTSTLDLLWFL